MSVEVCYNDTDKGKLEYSGRNLSRYHFADHKFYMDWS
jgi:hypothetical protein